MSLVIRPLGQGLGERQDEPGRGGGVERGKKRAAGGRSGTEERRRK